MHISATVSNTGAEHQVEVATNGVSQFVSIPAKESGKGSSINGGELLFMAIATCFCNDIYREAKKRNLEVKSVTVDVSGEFGGEGDPGYNIHYDAKVNADCSEEEIEDLISYVDKIAEVHNTIRKGTPVLFRQTNG